MEVGTFIIVLVIGLIASAAAFAGGYFVRKFYAERLIRTAESKAREILVAAKRESEEILRKSDKQAKAHISSVQSDFDNKIAQQKRDLENAERILKHKEDTMDQKTDLIEKNQKEALYRLQEAAQKELKLHDREQHLEKMIAEEKEVLQRLSGLNAEEAKNQFLKITVSLHLS